MGYNINLLLHIPLNKMGLLSAKIGFGGIYT
jgi:hypothetical protein